jgi:hypothetical protein
MQQWLKQITPFIFLGIALVVFTFGMILLSYLFIFGAAVGLLLFIVNWIKKRFFTRPSTAQPKRTQGRIIESDEWKKW